MSSSSNPLLSHVVIIKQFYFRAEIEGVKRFQTTCSNLQKSDRFKNFKWPEKSVFSKHFREEEETFRAFEMKDGVDILNLQLINVKLNGTLRILTTLYRAGFVVLSLVHSVVPRKKTGDVRGKNLTPDKTLTSIDVNYLLEDQTSDRPVPLKYEVQMQETNSEMTTSDLIGFLLKNLADQGMKIREKPMKFTRTIQCWNPSLSSQTLQKLLKKHYKDIFIMFTTPKEGSLPAKTKKAILKDLESHLLSSSKNRGFLFDSISMLIISPRKGPPHRILHSQLFWIYQLVSLEDFLLKFYSREMRAFVPRMSFPPSSEYHSLLEEAIKLRVTFSLCLEDLYWVENDLFRIQSAAFVTKYKRKFKLEEKLNNLLKRLAWIQDRCEDVLRAQEYAAERSRERSIRNLTLIFATFGLGEILFAIILWSLSYIATNQIILELETFAYLVTPVPVLLSVYLIARWFVNKQYNKTG